jgi:glycerol uptake facilitator-like aquaporin
MYFTGRLKSKLIHIYIFSQILGCLAGVGLANFFFELPIYELSSKTRDGVYIFVAEVVATFGLILIIFGSMKSGKVVTAACVGFYITAGYWFTSSTSFANPAVAIARTFTDTFTGINYLNTPFYIIAELLGMLIAIFLVKIMLFMK